MKEKINLKKTILFTVILNFTQLLSLIGLIVYILYVNNWQVPEKFAIEYLIFGFFLVISFTNSIIKTKISYNNLQTITINNELLKNIEQLDDLNKSLRAQRHDFLNHLQVVYGLIEMDEFVETKII